MIEGIWENPYVCKLGILDHCNELAIINNEIIRQKNNVEENHHANTKDLERHFKMECIDLLLILSNYLNVGLLSNDNEISYREQRFREKARDDEIEEEMKDRESPFDFENEEFDDVPF